MKTCRIWLILIIPLLLFPAACQAAERADGALRQPAVAGKFYPESAPMLRLAVEKFMQDALPPVAKDPVAIIVPHAGYVFSGQICADGFNQVRGRKYDTVVILGTNHTSPSFSKVGLYPGRGFITPLGTAAIDSSIVEALLAECPDCTPQRRDPRERTFRRGYRPLRAGPFPGCEDRPGRRGRAGCRALRTIRAGPGKGPQGPQRTDRGQLRSVPLPVGL